MWATEMTWHIADEAMQVRGGRGYETAHSLAGRGEPPISVERFLRDCRVNTIFEGSSEIMRLFIAREALDPHFESRRRDFQHAVPMSERAKAVFTSGKFYAGWYPKQWMPGGAGKIDNLHSDLEGHVNYAARTSKRLARGLFHAMARFGPKLDRSNCSFPDLSGSRRNCLRSAQPVRSRSRKSTMAHRAMKSCRWRIISAIGETSDPTSFRRHQR